MGKQNEVEVSTEICVVGGGLAGIAAAIAAARCGRKVVLVGDRPVLGGNASSEIRMWPRGCRGRDNAETGILEEIFLENMYRNPTKNFPIWDSILYGKVREEPNITLFLNCSIHDLTMDGDTIRSVKGWQLTTYTTVTITAKLFIDCSGDSILAPLSGATYRMGKEAASEYGESIEPEEPSTDTMGASCMIQAIETDRKVSYIPPKWAKKITEEDLEHRGHSLADPLMNYWWMELGGDKDSIKDTESVRDELLSLAFGVWDHIKNADAGEAANWDLDFLGFLPGKRESIRYIGDCVMTQGDVEAGGHFDDLIAFGGWPMDDHDPRGFNHHGAPNVNHHTPTPYGIPYRCLYSKNIRNLMFAGRNISMTHAAPSSGRVMNTCAILGQAAGTAAAMALADGLSPRGIYEMKIAKLQQKLMEDDCYLPWHKRAIAPFMANVLVRTADGTSTAHLFDGIGRNFGDEEHGVYLKMREALIFTMRKPEKPEGMRIVFDSDLNRDTCTGQERLKDSALICNRPKDMEPFGFPKTMVREYIITYRDTDGKDVELVHETNNYQRLVKIPMDVYTEEVRFIPLSTWGSEEAHLFACELY